MQAVSFKSNPSWMGLDSFYSPFAANTGLVGVHAIGSILYYKLQPVIWIALKDGSTEKGITYPYEDQSAGMG